MESEKSFLEVWKEVIYKLRDEGFVTDEEIKNGVDLPFEWLYSSGIQRDAIILALRNIYENQHPNNKYKFERFKKLASLQYCEKDGKPALEVCAGKASVSILEEEVEADGWNKNVTSQEFINRIISANKRLKMFELEDRGNMSKEEASLAIKIFYDYKQLRNEWYAMPHNLSEMAINFGEYYKYIQQEAEIAQQAETKEDEPIEISGGIIDPAVDDVGPRGPKENSARPRVSEIYPFEQRDEIFRNLNPERIIKFKGIDKDTGAVIDGVLTCYIYNKPQGNDGYVIISEPLEGNKETQAFYLTTEFVESLKTEGEDINEFWKDLVTEYIEKMTRSEFAQEDETYTFRHTTDLEAYRQKIEGIVKGLDNNPQKENVKRASYNLYGKATLVNGLKYVRRSRLDQIREKLFGTKENVQTNEGEDITND